MNTKKSLKRVRTGCFTCRARKKKCDEAHPSCQNCKRGSYECVWPAKDHEKLPHKSFEARKIHGSKTVFVCFLMEDQKLVQMREEHMGPEMREEYMEPKMVQNPQVPNTKINEESSMLLNVFLDDFLPRLSPQFTAPFNTPKATLVSLLTSAALREVCYACGASFLARRDPKMRELAKRSYDKCILTLFREVRSPFVDGSEEWLAHGLLLLSLREKHFGDREKYVHHLIAVYQLLQSKRYATLNTADFGVFDKLRFQQYMTQPLKGEDSHKFLSHFQDEIVLKTWLPANYSFSAYDKFYADSFAYNYSVELLVCSDEALRKLPSPFDFYSDFREIMTKPLYNLPEVWTNNPVLGAAREGFETCAKASWIARMPHLFPLYKDEAELMYHTTALATLDDIPEECLSLSESEITHLRCRVVTKVILLKASHLLLRKILFPDTTAEDEVIQRDVDSILSFFQMIPEFHPTITILPWPVLIAGAATVQPHHRSYIVRLTRQIGNFTESLFADHMSHFLKTAWTEMGLDILFHRPSLEKVCV